jgi:hypothetical protein
LVYARQLFTDFGNGIPVGHGRGGGLFESLRGENTQQYDDGSREHNESALRVQGSLCLESPLCVQGSLCLESPLRLEEELMPR